MKLVFYSGGQDEDNLDLDLDLVNLANCDDPLITYIPSCSYNAEVMFNEFIEHYGKFGISRFLYFPIDTDYDDVIFSEAIKSDVIYLSGGNTFYFLNWLKRKKLISTLKKYVANGGVLAGLSAGAIIMTPNVNTAAVPEFDRDENDEKLRNFNSLALVNFEFFPHFKNSKRYIQELLKYSKKTKNDIYACPDGSGIIFSSNFIKFIGKCFLFSNGKKTTIK